MLLLRSGRSLEESLGLKIFGVQRVWHGKSPLVRALPRSAEPEQPFPSLPRPQGEHRVRFRMRKGVSLRKKYEKSARDVLGPGATTAEEPEK